MFFPLKTANIESYDLFFRGICSHIALQLFCLFGHICVSSYCTCELNIRSLKLWCCHYQNESLNQNSFKVGHSLRIQTHTYMDLHISKKWIIYHPTRHTYDKQTKSCYGALSLSFFTLWILYNKYIQHDTISISCFQRETERKNERKKEDKEERDISCLLMCAHASNQF